MRTLSLLLLSTACAPTGALDAGDEPRQRVVLTDSEATQPARIELQVECADVACTSLWLSLSEEPPAPPIWEIDGVQIDTDSGVQIDLAPRVPVQLEVIGEGVHFLAKIEMPTDPGEVGLDTQTVVMGFDLEASCRKFFVIAVGGCLSPGTDLFFHPSWGDSVHFQTLPLDLKDLGHAYAAWWPGGGWDRDPFIPQGVGWDTGARVHQGFEYWFWMPGDSFQRVEAEHGWGGGAMSMAPLAAVHCTDNGIPTFIQGI